MGDTQKYQKKWRFWSKTCLFRALQNLTKFFLKNDKFLFLLPFGQFLSNFLPKGLIGSGKANANWTPQAEKPQVNRKLRTDFRTWNVQGPISFFGSPRIFFVRRQKKPGRHSRYGYWSENLGNVAQSHSKLQFNDFFPGFHQKKLENWSISKKLKSKSCLELIFMFT